MQSGECDGTADPSLQTRLRATVKDWRCRTLTRFNHSLGNIKDTCSHLASLFFFLHEVREVGPAWKIYLTWKFLNQIKPFPYFHTVWSSYYLKKKKAIAGMCFSSAEIYMHVKAFPSWTSCVLIQQSIVWTRSVCWKMANIRHGTCICSRKDQDKCQWVDKEHNYRD